MYREAYEKYPVFRDYVDKLATKHKIPIEEALEHRLVHEVYKLYSKRGFLSEEGDIKDERINLPSC